MENKQTLLFPFWIVAIILGVTLYKQFDFKNLRFEKPELAIVYIIVFLFSVYYIVKNTKRGSEK
jgi:predicted ferric reductase